MFAWLHMVMQGLNTHMHTNGWPPRLKAKMGSDCCMCVCVSAKGTESVRQGPTMPCHATPRRPHPSGSIEIIDKDDGGWDDDGLLHVSTSTCPCLCCMYAFCGRVILWHANNALIKSYSFTPSSPPSHSPLPWFVYDKV